MTPYYIIYIHFFFFLKSQSIVLYNGYGLSGPVIYVASGYLGV